jgi:N-acetylneuraminic acid mutarotase
MRFTDKPLPPNPLLRMGSSKRSLDTSKKSLEFDNSVISSLDDFYALNLTTNCWYKIQCSLAPLPRKGHSMTVAPVVVDGMKQDCIILFGGFSAETNSLSNTVHICTVRDVLSTLRKYEVKKEKGNRNILEYAPPVTWKTLTTTGKGPPPRYRHSACIIDRDISRINQTGHSYSESQSSLMVVFGGIVGTHFDTTRAFNDIYVLDLDTHAWIRTSFGPDALSMRYVFLHSDYINGQAIVQDVREWSSGHLRSYRICSADTGRNFHS